MIQRIQSVFLLVAAILMGIILVFPISEIEVNEGIPMAFSAFGIGNDFKTWGVLTFCLLSTIMPVINIFMYKKRVLQARLALVTILFILIYIAAIVVYLISFVKKAGDVQVSMDIEPVIVLPFVAIIANLLAYWRIRKDEKLVKSLDRIR